MPKSFFTSILNFPFLLLFLIISCTPTESNKEIIHAKIYSNDASIISDVDSALATLSNGIIKNDADMIFSIFSTTYPTKYVRNGHIYNSINEARKQYKKWLRSADTDREFSFLEKDYKIINDSIVLFTGIGAIERYEDDKKIAPWVIAYTILWANESQEWKARNMHISWEN